MPVREGGVDDLPRVLEILVAAFAQHEGRIDPPSGANAETVDSLAEKLERETLLVAERDGVVAGCIWCRDAGEGELYIGRLAVDPTFQSAGIGRALLDASIRLAEAGGFELMSLGVRVELVENIAFFERHGFRITRGDSHPGYERITNHHMERRGESEEGRALPTANS